MSAQQKPSQYSRYVNLIIGIILAVFLIIFGSQSLADGVVGLLLGFVSYAAALVLLYVTFLNYYRFGAAQQIPEKTYTVYRCPTCGYQLVKDFAFGDYVGKAGETCPKDGSQMVIEKIYTVGSS